MCRTIGKIISFGIKVLVVMFIFAWLEQSLNRLINFIVQKWKTRGIDPRQLSIDEMEKYYMEHGIQCCNCLCWIPAEVEKCPVCAVK